MNDEKYDFRKKNIKINEDIFINEIRESDIIYKFANKLLFNVLKIAQIYISNDDIINNISIMYFNQNNNKKYSRIPGPAFKIKNDAIIKNGYKCNIIDCKKIIKMKNYKELLEYNKENDIKLLQITGAIYKFQIEDNIISGCIKEDKKLHDIIIETFCKYFNIKNMSFKDLEKLINKSHSNWFIPWLYLFASSNTQNLMHRNLNENAEYIRKWVRVLQNKTDVETVDINNKKMVDNIINQYEDDKVNKLILGKTFMKPKVNGIWWNIMKENEKYIIAGPSSSSVLCFEFYFNITKILKPSKKNKIKLLMLILADYYPIHHSITEILIQYTVDSNLPLYSLDMNDISYIKKLIKSNNIKY